MHDAVVVGSGPNGLAAAITLLRSGLSVLVVEAKDTIGGGARTRELTLPGFQHDVCSAIHPIGVISPFFRAIGLGQRVEWINPPLALAHPLPDGGAAALSHSFDETSEFLGSDGPRWRRLLEPYSRRSDAFFSEILRPIRSPRHPFLMARFGLSALQSCKRIVRRFEHESTKMMFAGCAAHSVLPLDKPATASFGMVLAISAHAVGWPLVRGGSQAITNALAAMIRDAGGEIETGREIRSLADLPPARAVLFDLTPRQLDRIAGDRFPDRFRKKLRSFRYGPGVFKIDWALSGPVPWKNDACRRAATVHLGGSLAEIYDSEDAAWSGRIAEKPFVLFAQQSLFDTRAPQGQHTGWAYCHVPHGSTVDMTDAIERQVERFAPGFRDLILARHTINSAQLEEHNPNMIGGDIGEGANDLAQFLFRPFLTTNPYGTPAPSMYICSSSTPPGGGVHGMSGFRAANSALRHVFGKKQMRLES